MFVVAILLWGIVFLNASVEPVRLAVITAQTSDLFREIVGQPVQTGVFVRGTMDPFSSSGNAHLTIPISGDRGVGVLREWAQQESGKWRLCWLVYRPDNGQPQVTIVSDKDSPCRPD
jgi:Cytochrome oxidase complex assembly protein 1